MNKVNNALFNTTIKIGASKLKQGTWYFINVLFFLNPLFPISFIKIFLLRTFGAKIGSGVIIKPSVNIKYPWKLIIGDNTWVGERVWIDNLDEIIIGSSVCISQGAFLLTGNHDYKKISFNLITAKIIIEDGVWIGANAIVCPGVTCSSHAVLSVASVASKNMEAYAIYRGNPAIFIKKRIII